MPDLEKMIQDIIEGAKRGGAGVERQCDRGREEKLAAEADPRRYWAALMAAGILPGTIAGALSAGEGHRLEGAGLGTLGGALGAIPMGAATGYSANKLTPRGGHSGISGALGMLAGAPIGSAIGGGLAGRLAREEESGKQAALQHYKVAFIAPLVGMAARLGGGALAQRGLGAAAQRLGGGALGRAAGAGAKFLGGTGFKSQMGQMAIGEGMGQLADRATGANG